MRLPPYCKLLTDGLERYDDICQELRLLHFGCWQQYLETSFIHVPEGLIVVVHVVTPHHAVCQRLPSMVFPSAG